MGDVVRLPNPFEGSSRSSQAVFLDGRFVGSFTLVREGLGDLADWRAVTAHGTVHRLYGTMEAVEAKVLDAHAEDLRVLLVRNQKGVLHIRRPPLPWHRSQDGVSLCGRSKAKLVDRIPDGGEDLDRICRTCKDLARYRRQWEDDPLDVLHSWIEDGNKDRRAAAIDQLRAVGFLAQENLDRFWDLVDGERGLRAFL